MKSGHLIVIGSAIAGCAASMAVYLMAAGGSAVDATSRHAAAQGRQAASNHLPPAPSALQRLPRTGNRDAEKPRLIPGSTNPGFRVSGTPAGGSSIDENVWFAKAEHVAREANRELEMLRESLDLRPGQERRIFDILARNSPSWQPGMITEGPQRPSAPGNDARFTSPADDASPADASAPLVPTEPVDSGNFPVSVADAVIGVLDFDQQQSLIQEELARRAWWEEILPQLLPPDFPVASEAGHYPADLPGHGDTKAYQGPVEIFED